MPFRQKLTDKEIKLCMCGCEKVVKNQYVSGHNRRNAKHTKKSRQKMRQSHLGIPLSEERKRNLSKIRKGWNPWKYVNKERWLKAIRKRIGILHTEKHKKKISMAVSGKKNPFYGKHHTAETKIRLREVNIGRKCPDRVGEKNPAKRPEVREKISKNCSMKRPEVVAKLRGRPLSEEHRKHLSENHANFKKENNPCWRGGRSFEPYAIEFDDILKEKIRKRDNYQCQECGYPQKDLGYKLHIHHIDYNKKNSNLINLVSLCRNCHMQTNFDRKDWTNYFKQKRIRINVSET